MDEIKTKNDAQKTEQQQSQPTPSASPTPQKQKPSFLDEIKAKNNLQKTEQQQSHPTSSTNPTPQRQKPSFLDQIKAKVVVGKSKEKDQTDATQSPLGNDERKEQKYLGEIEAKEEKQNDAAHQHSIYSPSDSSMDTRDNGVEAMKANTQLEEKTDESQFTTTKEAAAMSDENGEASKDYLDRRTLPEPLSNNTKKILRELECNEIRQKKLEKSLIQNGISVTEDISYEEAKDKIAEITESMKELMAAGMDSFTMEKEYFRLEEQLSKYSAALMLTDEYIEELRRLEQEWEDSIENDNILALRKLRSHMPIKIRHMTEEELVTTPTPNGKTLPKVVARKFKRTNILQLLRVDPDDIEMMHPSLLENTRTTGLTLTERRALHMHFRDVVGRWTEKRSDPSIEKKWQWYQSLKLKFKETLNAHSRGQCPIKANSALDYDIDYGYTMEATYESTSNRKVPKKQSSIESSPKERSQAVESSESKFLQEYRDRLNLDQNETEVDKKLLRELFHCVKRTKTLEKQLTHAGLSLPKEDISYAVAKTRVAELTEELGQIAAKMGTAVDAKEQAKLEHTFGKLSKELDKFTNALMLTKEWVQEQKDKERQWETDVSAANLEALQKVRRHMPVNIRNVSETSLMTDPTPNGKILPKAFAKKFKRTNILMILRTDPSVIEAMHPSSLEAMRTTGLTLTERRAIHEHMKEIAPKWKAMTSDKMCERKWMWHASLQSKLKEMIEKYDKHVEKYGPDGVGSPLIGNQCPIKANLVLDYSGDYGFPEDAVYEQQTVAKSNLLSMEELEKRRQEDDYY